MNIESINIFFNCLKSSLYNLTFPTDNICLSFVQFVCDFKASIKSNTTRSVNIHTIVGERCTDTSDDYILFLKITLNTRDYVDGKAFPYSFFFVFKTL